MTYLNSDQIHQLLSSLGAEYDQLNENRIKLENDCTKLREFIDSQIQQIQILNSDFEKLRIEFIQRKDEFVARAQQEQAVIPTAPPIPEEAPAQEEDWSQEIDIQPLPGAKNCPLSISLSCEIVDVSVICSTTFSPDGQCLAIGSDNAIRVYAIDTDIFLFQHQVEANPKRPNNYIRTIAWTPDSKRVLCGSEDSKIRIFEVPADRQQPADADAMVQPVKIMTDFKDQIYCIQCSSDGKFFATTTADGTLSIVDLNTYNVISIFPREGENNIVATSLSIFHDDNLVAVCYSTNDVWIFNLEQNKVVCKASCHSKSIYAIKFINNSNRLVTSSLDNTIKIWDMIWNGDNIELKLWKSLDKHTDFIVTLDVDSSGKYLLSGSKDKTVKLSDITHGEMAYSIQAHQNSIITVNFNPKRPLFCSGSGDKSVKIFSYGPPEQ
ncbi:hypothetical protein TVAG_021340 [Trichomonas vaginalis G3]|uniref:Uncharacterized protein n=1 Tax=Trichomonas vaginalis (strain ATCC PRA-98 / G3) TaxID=412133 RepID=A2DHB6_TRIV3|nr:WD repeat-containing protein family [Trichomonas vaginalis G3]EAY20189.1 hypothetical protein TVAG_021340 [Trichomonas vaginalis G3]KAI5507668.1 WD repeat-containing protein family [Trichomonas vaginalis G3]|eukprot:XP_001581175.1 hypothetical protein [Trichomonas vaginalis G3]